MTVYHAKVTSKGQVTLPLEVRRALELEPGAYIAFEVARDYAVVTRQRSTAEIVRDLAVRSESAKPRYASDEEAVGAFFAGDYLAEEDLGDQVLSLRVPPSLLEGL